MREGESKEQTGVVSERFPLLIVMNFGELIRSGTKEKESWLEEERMKK